jgi:cytochrome c-type biogenesis protein CcmE
MGFVLSSLFEASSYANFAEAFENDSREYHVVGTLDKTHGVVYDPMANPNLTIFHLKDESGVSKKVKLFKSKPQDFEKSETIVIIGEAEGDEFHANEILMKCPSKYESDTKVQNQVR